MTRLQTEFQRLYLLAPEAGDRTRAMVLELAGPAGWVLLSAVWRGVQADLELPAPAIAVNGRDALQLWFSLSEPINTGRAEAWLEALRRHYLSGVARARVRLLPGVATASSTPDTPQLAPRVPALQAETGNWSAFVAQDLAPIFEDAPWLDIPPGDEGQAHLLSALASIKPAQFAAAEAQLGATSIEGAALPLSAVDVPSEPARPMVGGSVSQDPKSFLLAVMRDEGQLLALRIEAAKALLPYTATLSL